MRSYSACTSYVAATVAVMSVEDQFRSLNMLRIDLTTSFINTYKLHNDIAFNTDREA